MHQGIVTILVLAFAIVYYRDIPYFVYQKKVGEIWQIPYFCDLQEY